MAVAAAPCLETPEAVLAAAVADQVKAYDERFLSGSRALAAGSAGAAGAQARAFGRRDGTGVEAVHDAMPAEYAAFRRLVEASAHGRSTRGAREQETLLVLDFGCGDGRYLQLYLRAAEELQRSHGVRLRVVAYEVSVEALRSFHLRALAAGLAESPAQPSCGSGGCGLPELAGEQLEVDFVLGAGDMDVRAVEELLRARHACYDVVVAGWGTLSSIPRTAAISAERLLEFFARAGRHLMNVASTTNNHVRFQRQFAARRLALAQAEENPAARAWLQRRLGLATFDGSYYYPVDTGQQMFYAAVTADQEVARLAAAGFADVQLRICNIINFFDILTKPRAAKLDVAVRCLLERGDAWGAQLLLSRCVSRAFGRPLRELRVGSCIFDTSGSLSAQAQVARYFISSGAGAAGCLPPGTEAAGER